MIIIKVRIVLSVRVFERQFILLGKTLISLTFDIANFQTSIYRVFWTLFTQTSMLVLWYKLIARETFAKTVKIMFSEKLLKLLLGDASITRYFKRLFYQILQTLCSISVEIIHLKSIMNLLKRIQYY